MTAINQQPISSIFDKNYIYEDYCPADKFVKQKKSDFSEDIDLTDSFVLLDDDYSSMMNSWVEVDTDINEQIKSIIAKNSNSEQVSETLETTAEYTSETDDHETVEQPLSWYSAISNQLNVLCNATVDIAKKAISSNPPDVVPDTRTIAEKNTDDAKELVFKIQEKLERLNGSIFRITGDHIAPLDAGRIDPAQISTWDSLQTFTSRAQGAVTALLDTSVGVGTGAVVGGVGSTGILGFGLGLAATAGGALLALKSLRQLPQNANTQAVFNEIDRLLPEIQKDLQELDAIVSQEQYRQQVGQRIMATMAMRYDLCTTMNHTLTGLQQESDARVLKQSELAEAPESADATTNNPPVALPVSAQTMQQNDSIRSEFFQHVERARDALHTVIDALVQTFNALRERISLITPTRQATAQANAERDIEEAFKKTYATMLLDLADSKGSGLDSGAHLIALQNMKNGDSSTKATSATLLADMKRGENLAGVILSSYANFGAIKYTASAGTQQRNYAVPSNLTTIRSIANYIDGQAISNAKNPAIPGTTAAISQNPDGTYTIADPERKLYNFLAGAPTARMNLVEHEQDTSASLLDREIGSMAITDYSHMLPGGAHKMVFKPQLDHTGTSVLTVRFSKQDQPSADTSHQAVTSDIIQKMQENLVLVKPSAPALDFSALSRAELWNKLDDITLACQQQMKLLDEDKRQMAALNQWANPIYLKQA